MKRYLLIIFILLSTLSLTGCVNHRSPYLYVDLSKERWMSGINTNPALWTRGADTWFLTNDPNRTELADRNAPIEAAISTMTVRVPEFSNIKVNGGFQVQIFGTDGPNSVYVFGPNSGVRKMAVEVRGDTLCINEIKEPPRKVVKGIWGNKPIPIIDRSITQVIVRIGVRQLHNIRQLGCGSIEGVQLRSENLNIISAGRGNIILSGNLNVRRIISMGSGSVTVFGACTPALNIRTAGFGSVNVSGNVGVQHITHHGFGNINIIGANTHALRIRADGRGKIAVQGRMNLCEINAADDTCVYAYSVNSGTLNAYARGHARIGLAGYSHNVYVFTTDAARFEGRYLCTDNAFIKARYWSHINVTASNRVFASATESASIYDFGAPEQLSRFVNGKGVVLPLNAVGNCPIPRLIDYKAEAGAMLPGAG